MRDTAPPAQYEPASQKPLGADRAGAAQYEPAVQFVHADAPGGANVPAAHCCCVASDEPAGHACPPWHEPDTALRPVMPQYEPAGHCVGPLMSVAGQYWAIGHARAVPVVPPAGPGRGGEGEGERSRRRGNELNGGVA